jgi:peptide/nickel transport system substrate-binding protein
MTPELGCVNYSKFFSSMTMEPKVLDDHTIEITTDSEQPILPALLANMTIVSMATPMDEQTREPIGTGPFAFADWTPEKVVLKRFDDYWGELPEVDEVTYVWRSESTVRAAMVSSGEADLAPSIAPQDAIDPETDRSYLTAATLTFQITAQEPPLDDIRIRKALNLAVDRDAFVGTILSSDVKPATQNVIPSAVGYNPDLAPWPYDLEQAKALVAEAKADGEPVDQEILVAGTPYFPNATEILPTLAQMWQAAGLNTKSQIFEPAQYNDLRTKPYAEDRLPMLLIDDHDNNSGDAAITLLYKYYSGGRNSNFNDPELDALIESGAAASGEERAKFLQEAFA